MKNKHTQRKNPKEPVQCSIWVKMYTFIVDVVAVLVLAILAFVILDNHCAVQKLEKRITSLELQMDDLRQLH